MYTTIKILLRYNPEVQCGFRKGLSTELLVAIHN